MFVTDKLVYLQLQKTGCTHIVRVMKELVGGESMGRKHGRLKKDFVLDGRRIVGSIRDPWSWYVSLWAFGCIHSGAIYTSTTSRNFLKYLTGGEKDPDRSLRDAWRTLTKPAGRWRRLYADSDNPALFREWLRMTCDPRRAHDLGQGYAESTLSRFAGLLTYRYVRLHSSDIEPLFGPNGVGTLEALRDFDQRHNLVNLVIRNESLEADLIAVLKRVGHYIDGSAEARIRVAQKTNTSSHKPASEYYDAETRELVARREAFIIEKYGYGAP
jgi:hypothetical protein